MDNSILIYILFGFFIGIVFISLIDDIAQYIYKHIHFSELELLQFDELKKLRTYRELRKEYKSFDYVFDKLDNHNESEEKSNEKTDN